LARHDSLYTSLIWATFVALVATSVVSRPAGNGRALAWILMPATSTTGSLAQYALIKPLGSRGRRTQ